MNIINTGGRMKKLIYYLGIILISLILLPLIIVKGCSYKKEEPYVKQPPAPERKVLVYISAKKAYEEMGFDEYLKGVVAAEMPANFELEALKAQAVAARTFAYGRLIGAYESKQGVHDKSRICTDYAHCQAYISREEAGRRWGIFLAGRRWKKIEKAVLETRGIIITYQGKVINALFHSNSGGITENSGDVWEGITEPYLVSVRSYGEDIAKDYTASTVYKNDNMVSLLQQEYPDILIDNKKVFESLHILDYTHSGRVKNIKVGNIIIKGTDFRRILGLRSTYIKLEKDGGNAIKITTKGYGHGVGMSQWGAEYLARRGGTFDEILKYYYKGVELGSIQQ